jgi:hypothetical protein
MWVFDIEDVKRADEWSIIIPAGHQESEKGLLVKVNTIQEQTIKLWTSNKLRPVSGDSPDSHFFQLKTTSTLGNIGESVILVQGNTVYYLGRSGTYPISCQIHRIVGIEHRLRNFLAAARVGWYFRSRTNQSLQPTFGQHVDPAKVFSVVSELIVEIRLRGEDGLTTFVDARKKAISPHIEFSKGMNDADIIDFMGMLIRGDDHDPAYIGFVSGLRHEWGLLQTLSAMWSCPCSR